MLRFSYQTISIHSFNKSNRLECELNKQNLVVEMLFASDAMRQKSKNTKSTTQKANFYFAFAILLKMSLCTHANLRMVRRPANEEAKYNRDEHPQHTFAMAIRPLLIAHEVLMIAAA